MVSVSLFFTFVCSPVKTISGAAELEMVALYLILVIFCWSPSVFHIFMGHTEPLYRELLGMSILNSNSVITIVIYFYFYFFAQQISETV